VGQGGQQVSSPAVGAAGAAKGLAVQGDDLHLLGVGDVVQRSPGTQDDVQSVGVQALQGAPDGGFGGDFAQYSQPAHCVGSGRLGPLGDRDEGSAAGHDSAGNQCQDAVQFMAQPLPLPGIGDCPERGQQGRRCRRYVGELVLIELVNNGVCG
jgi:hypothetical protein